MKSSNPIGLRETSALAAKRQELCPKRAASCLNETVEKPMAGPQEQVAKIAKTLPVN